MIYRIPLGHPIKKNWVTPDGCDDDFCTYIDHPEMLKVCAYMCISVRAKCIYVSNNIHTGRDEDFCTYTREMLRVCAYMCISVRAKCIYVSNNIHTRDVDHAGRL